MQYQERMAIIGLRKYYGETRYPRAPMDEQSGTHSVPELMYRQRRRDTCSVPGPGACRACGSTAVIPVEYGLPTTEMLKSYAAGRLALGGVRQTATSPRWRCRDCSRTWAVEASGPSSSP